MAVGDAYDLDQNGQMKDQTVKPKKPKQTQTSKTGGSYHMRKYHPNKNPDYEVADFHPNDPIIGQKKPSIIPPAKPTDLPKLIVPLRKK